MKPDEPGHDLDDELLTEWRPSTALDRVRQVSQTLSDMARRSRMSARARSAYSGGGFQARQGAGAIRLALVVSFGLIVVAPTLAGIAYYGFLASDQFVSEADFTVSGGETPAPQGIGAITGIPMAAIIQDTQIVVNYIHSRAAVEALQQSVDLKNRYAGSNVDWLSRVNPHEPIEKFLDFWQGMSDVSIKMPAGIVQLQICAFTPQDAQTIAQATLAVCEKLINDMNDRMNSDAVSEAEEELQRTSQRLEAARTALEKDRNASGLLDPTQSAAELNKLITDEQSALLSMQNEYDTQLKYVQASAPQMRDLKSRIDVTQAQIADLQSKLTSAQMGTSTDPTIAAAMTQFGQLDLERQVAEHLYAGAATTLELARINAERKTMYLKTFVSPAMPQEALYPKRILDPLLIFLSCSVVWGALCGLGLIVRNNMA